MRPCTPTPSEPSATGRQLQTRRRPKRARRSGKIGAGTDTPTPVARGGPPHRSAPSAFFSSTGRGAFSFWARPKGAPAAPRAVGRGGARERAQFSPQAETELSGLCDDDNGGCICPAIPMADIPRPMGRTPTPPCGSSSPFPRRVRQTKKRRPFGRRLRKRQKRISCDYLCCSRILAKHSLQYTGRSDFGSKGTRASPPQAAQTAVKYSRGPRAAFLRASRQALHRWGSFWKPRSA